MSRYVFDLETDGLLPEVSTIHSLVLKNIETEEVTSCVQKGKGKYATIEHGLKLLADAELLIGHNIIDYDLRAIKKLHPKWSSKAIVRDTLVLSRLVYPDIKDMDFKNAKRGGKFPLQFAGRYSLEAWGHRLGNYKGDFKGPWDTWTTEMQDYCEQDVEVTFTLWKKVQAKSMPDAVAQLEHDVAALMVRQEDYGFKFDKEAAGKLYGLLLAKREELNRKLQEEFPPLTVLTPFTPKVNSKKHGYVKGVETIKSKVVEFNPSSRDHISARLIEQGWKPKEYTQEGKPKVDEEILESLINKFPSAALLNESLMIDKRIGQLAEGKEAWLKKCGSDGRMHGRVNSVGAVTRRMTHSGPNMTQVPSISSPYGEECRSLFIADKGQLLVGIDADALELRCLAGYMAYFDGGAYIETVLKGNKEDGTDMHTLNAKVLGCSRGDAKTWFYAFIYGAGDGKLGSILGKGAQAGRASREKFLASLPALKTIIDGVKKKVRKQGFIMSIDNAPLHIRSEHAAFNTLLQSAGAIFMKRAQVILDADLQSRGWTPGKQYEFTATVHDEWQIEVEEKHADEVGRAGTDAIAAAGRFYNFKCPLAGNYVVGPNWAATH